MRKIYFLALLLISVNGFGATLTWDGGAGDGLWASATNWVGDVAPTSADDVVLDNSALAGTYTVTLPTGNVNITILSLTITPGTGNNITLVLPSGNTNSPGLTTTNDIILNNGATFKNSSGGAAPTITIGNGTNDSLYIRNGGTYEHNNIRSSTTIMDKMSTAIGTEYGRFHFNVPASGTTSISLQGRTFGSLEFSAGNAPTALTYSSASTTTATPTAIRGDFVVNTPAIFSSTMIGGLSFAGNFTNSGSFTYIPASSANPGTRSIYFNGTGNTQVISGSGNVTIGTNFVKMEISNGAVVSLQRTLNVFGTFDSVVVKPNATLIFNGENFIGGSASIFFNDTLSTLKISSADGIPSVSFFGNVQTTFRNFSKKANYYYTGTLAQVTGDGLPDSVYRLYIQNPYDVTLYKNVCVTKVLGLDSGHLITSSSFIPKLASGAAITSQGTNVYGETNVGNASSFVSGPMSIETNTTDSLTFPVGRKSGLGTVYAPVKLKPGNAVAKTYTVEYFSWIHSDAANIDATLDHVSQVEYWDITSSAGTVPNIEAKVSLSWRPTSLIGTGNPVDSATAMQDLVVSHYFNDGFTTRWNMDGGPGPTFTVRPNATLSYGYITTDMATGTFSPFTFGTKSGINFLPLTLVNFGGTARGNQVDLQWITKEEQRVIRYEVEKSLDGVRFSKIATVAAANNTNLQQYAALDANAPDGWNYYRLKVFDNQQHSYYTATVKVWVGSKPRIEVYPNPAKDFLKFILPVSSKCEIRIVNTSGQVVKRVNNAQGQFTVDVQSLDQGMYFIYILQTDRQAIVQRFVKQ